VGVAHGDDLGSWLVAGASEISRRSVRRSPALESMLNSHPCPLGGMKIPGTAFQGS
ncbi:unnamed protein product, partial [Gulo gulo]